MTEYERLREAFVRVCGEPVREPPGQVCDDERNPERICWIAKNVWLCPDDPKGRDVQIHAWHGEAWVSQGERSPGIWCGLNIEFKVPFRAALRFANSESVAGIVQALDEYRVSFGSKEWPTQEFTARDSGRRAADVDWRSIFMAIPEFDGDSKLRPQLQVYRQIGDWLNSSNTIERLTLEITAVRSELSELFRLVTGGYYPP